jgi:hypothetical protein
MESKKNAAGGADNKALKGLYAITGNKYLQFKL